MKQLNPVRDEVAPEMAIKKAYYEISRTVEHEQPRKEEVPAAPGRKILIPWKGDPRGESTHDRSPGRSPGESKDASRIEGPPEDFNHSAGREGAIPTVGSDGE